MHEAQGARPQGQRQVLGIAPVGLDPVTRFLRDQRGSGHHAIQRLASQVAVQPEAARAGLVNQLQSAHATELVQQPIDRVLLGTHAAQINNRIGGLCSHASRCDRVLMDIQPNIDGGIVHFADLRTQGIPMVSPFAGSCGSGPALTHDNGPAEVSARACESHTV